MKAATTIALIAALAALTGCQTKYSGAGMDLAQQRADSTRMYDALMDDQVKQGVITQSTIYPHHFVTHTPTINSLGGRDLDILAVHYRDEVMPTMKPVDIVQDVQVFFDYNQSLIRSDAEPVLAGALQALKDRPDTDVIITGRADIRGSDEYNVALGERRAAAVRRYLESKGVDASRVRVVSRGEMDALAPESDEAGMQADRNAHFIVAAVQQYPLPLNVRRGDASDNLYQARKKSVLGFLADRGVDTDMIWIADGFAGGPGADSNRVFLIVTGTEAASPAFTSSASMPIGGGSN